VYNTIHTLILTLRWATKVHILQFPFRGNVSVSANENNIFVPVVTMRNGTNEHNWYSRLAQLVSLDNEKQSRSRRMFTVRTLQRIRVLSANTVPIAKTYKKSNCR